MIAICRSRKGHVGIYLHDFSQQGFKRERRPVKCFLIVTWNLVVKYTDLHLVQHLCSARGHPSSCWGVADEKKQSRACRFGLLELLAWDWPLVIICRSNLSLPKSLFDAVSDLFWISLTTWDSKSWQRGSGGKVEITIHSWSFTLADSSSSSTGIWFGYCHHKDISHQWIRLPLRSQPFDRTCRSIARLGAQGVDRRTSHVYMFFQIQNLRV